jgi:predicted alpha/beta-hydrolase family hydrolase
MPFHLAVFGVNSAEPVYDLVPEVTQWYLGGHSLGGAMASSYVGKHEEDLKGLILLGAYPVKDSILPTLAIYGSEDKVLNKDKLTLAKTKVEIAGGNHAYYGNYGEQKGDGIATISREEQQNQCVELISKFIQSRTE